MNSNVEIISKEIIKPSSQTPDHLNIFNLSFFDQFAPPVYFPIIFFYKADESRGLITSNHVQISQNLKKSLSETLTSFYPLAGRVHGSTINCNDAGVEFVDARVHSQLIELTQEPYVEQLKKLLPLDPATAGCPGQRTALLVQLNFFKCGGISIGICISHHVADMASMMTFITAWSTTHVGERKTSQLGFQHSRYFHAREFSGANPWNKILEPGENLGTKMLVFTKEKLSALRQQILNSSTGSTIEDPTRVELVSAFIWHHMSNFLKNNLKNRSFATFHTVNLRPRVGQKRFQEGQNHRILENVFGNFILPAFVFPESNTTVEEFHESLRKFRSSIRSIDIPNDTESQDRVINNVLSVLTNEEISELYFFTSWCRFPFYVVEFGWGKPIRVCTSSWGMKNVTTLMDNPSGEDVEAWMLNMDLEILQVLETQFKLI